MLSEKGKIYKKNKDLNYRNKKRTGENKKIKSSELESLIRIQDYKCNICFKNIKDRYLRQLDHIFPVSKGGKHELKNVQWLCCKCNNEKSNKIYE